MPFIVGLGTLVAFQFGGDAWLINLSDPLTAGILFLWLFIAMLWAAFGVVRHADALAELLGEPYGTLILTLAVIGIEVALISAVMLAGEAATTLARDTMLAVLMIVLNGLVGLALLLGGLAHGEQDYNLQGARAFMAVLLPLAVFSLILPKYTVSTATPTFSPFQEAFFAAITALLYGVFLAVQTVRHSSYFQEPSATDNDEKAHTSHGPLRSKLYHAVLLILTLAPIVLLSKRLALLVDFGIDEVGAPVALGGVIIALLVLTPEGLAALEAARANRLQRSVNLLLGSALATIGLTVPAVLAIGLIIDQPVVLGLDDVSMVLLILTLFTSALTFGGVRTGVLQGAVHVVLFLAYLALIFSP
ncbi:MAG: calcium:proton antiporter [Alphaproteobacteria bacterium]|nr:calcium:proton antiporter [Alphaproteobacteria bacterium]